MPATVFNDGDGIKRFREVRGEGTAAFPYEGNVHDKELNAKTGAPTEAPADRTTLTATGATAYSVIQLLKGILINSGTAGAAATNNSSFSTASPVTVGTTATEIQVMDVRGRNRASFTINNTGATAFSNLVIWFRTHPSAAWRQLTFAETDFTTDISKSSGNMGLPIINTSNAGGFGQPFLTMPAGGSGWIIMNVGGMSAIRVTATVAAGTTTATLLGNADS